MTPIELDNIKKDTLLQWIVDKFREDYNFVSDGQRLYFYDNGYYRPCESQIRLLSQKLTQDFDFYITDKSGKEIDIKHFLHEIEKKEIISFLMDTEHIEPDDWNIIPKITDAINVKNGILYHNGKKWIFGKHSSDFKFNYQLPFNYDPKAKCPFVDKLFSDWAKAEDIDFLWEWVGFNISTGYKFKKLLIIYGHSDNGKSEFCNLLIQFLGGKQFVSSKTLHDFSSDKNARGYLYSKRANVCADISDKEIGDDRLLKVLTGNDYISAPVKYKPDLEFRNEAKIVATANVVPFVLNATDAFYNRIILLEFPNCFTGHEKLNIVKENLTNEELAGMLNKAMIAYTRIFRAKRFSTVGGLAWKDNQERFVTLSNPLHNFVNDMCDIGTAYCCSQNELHQKYNEWGEGKAVSASRFNSYLLQLNAPIRQSHTTISGVATYIFQGIRPKSDFKGLAQLAQLAKIPKEVDE